MSKASHPELFIRLLAETLEEDRLVRSANRSLRYKASADRFRQLFQSDLKHALQSVEPMDCLQLMESRTPNLHAG